MKFRHSAVHIACVSAFSALAGVGFSGLAQAAPTTGAYATDPQSEYVSDATLESLNTPSEIFCYVANTRGDAMVNRGRFVAFVDEGKCSRSGRGNASQSSNTGNSAAVNYIKFSMDVTRADNNSLQIGKGHVYSIDDEDSEQAIYVAVTVTEAPSDSLPNGIATVRYAGKSVAADGTPGDVTFRGYISSAANGITYSEADRYGGGPEHTTQLFFSGNDTTGEGVVRAWNWSGDRYDTSTFGYTGNYFCRKTNGAAAKCFSRSRDDTKKSVWRYGVYNDGTGAAYDLQNPTFNIKRTDNGKYGMAGYWGVWIGPDLTDGLAVTHARTDEAYTVKKTAGKLWKHQKFNTTLSGIHRVPFRFHTQAAVNGVVLQGKNYEAYWDQDAGRFELVGLEDCSGSNGCYTQTATGTLTAAQMRTAGNNWDINGWSQGLGAMIKIADAALSDATPGSYANGVTYATRTQVLPGDSTVPGTLKCVQDCPTRDGLADTNADDGYTPFATGTNNWGDRAAGDVQTYTWNAGNYTLTRTGDAAALAAPTVASGNYQWSVQSGYLVAEGDLNSMVCQNGGNTYCNWKAYGLDTYYSWETGKREWNVGIYLQKADGSYVSFSAPQKATYVVPNEAAYGDYQGASLQLDFQGFGQLQGIPGHCFNPEDPNTKTDCSGNTRWAPAFVIPDGSTVTIGGATKWVKYLDSELRFNLLSGQAHTTALAAVEAAGGFGDAAGLPEAVSLTPDAEDPSNPASANYAGPWSRELFDQNPAVIHGVVQ